MNDKGGLEQPLASPGWIKSSLEHGDGGGGGCGGGGCGGSVGGG